MKAKRLCAGFAIASLLLMGGTAFAELNTNDSVPAATLLLPYFEVDLASANGVNTLFAIANASAAAQVAHVSVWSDLSVGVLDFNIFLTGYDVETVNLYDVFVNGRLPVTAHQRKDPTNTISPHGRAPYPVVPAWDSGAAGFPLCDNNLPLASPALQGTFLAYVKAALTGKPTSPTGGATRCYGRDYNDNRARGYITIDVARDCNLLFPDDPTYWTGQWTTTNNVLWGDFFYVDTANNFAQGENLVAIEATSRVPPFDTVPFVNRNGMLADLYQAGDYTFYGRYIAGALDQREPLSSVVGTRYLSGGAFDGGTNLIVWRDAKRAIAPFTCGTTPAPFPLGHTDVIAFDEAENAIRLCQVTSPISPPPPAQQVCFPWEAQRVTVGGGDLRPPFQFGWLFLNLNYNVGNTYPNAQNPHIMQNYVMPTMSALGRFSVGYRAVELLNAYWQGNLSIVPLIP